MEEHRPKMNLMPLSAQLSRQWLRKGIMLPMKIPSINDLCPGDKKISADSGGRLC